MHEVRKYSLSARFVRPTYEAHKVTRVKPLNPFVARRNMIFFGVFSAFGVCNLFFQFLN